MSFHCEIPTSTFIPLSQPPAIRKGSHGALANISGQLI